MCSRVRYYISEDVMLCLQTVAYHVVLCTFHSLDLHYFIGNMLYFLVLLRDVEMVKTAVTTMSVCMLLVPARHPRLVKIGPVSHVVHN